MNEREEPIFDFTVPDWDYLAIVSVVMESTIGKLHVLSLVYKDVETKTITRILLPSGKKVKFGTKKKYPSTEKAIDHVKYVISQFPTAQILVENVIHNTTTRGNDLFELMCRHPEFILTCHQHISHIRNQTNG